MKNFQIQLPIDFLNKKLKIPEQWQRQFEGISNELWKKFSLKFLVSRSCNEFGGKDIDGGIVSFFCKYEIFSWGAVGITIENILSF